MLEFIVNPNSRCGRGRKIWNQVEQKLKEQGVEYGLHMTSAPGDAEGFARQLTGCRGEEGRKPCTIAVLGGDGTLNEVIQGLTLKQPVTIGYIQCGSGNDFARGMKLESNPMKTLERILHPKHYRVVDYGIAATGLYPAAYRRFAVSAGIGWDAAICHNLLDSAAKRFLNKVHMGKLAYFVIGLKQWALAKPAQGTLVLDGARKIKLKNMLFLSAHNLKYEGGGFMFGPKADPEDGLLELCVMENMSKLKMVPAVLSAKFGRHGIFRGVHFYSCKEARVHMDRPLAVHADGESCGHQQDFAVTCQKKKLRFIV